MNYENDCLRILSAVAARNGRWLSLSSCVEYSGVPMKRVWDYVNGGDLDRQAYRYHYDIRAKRSGRTTFIAVISQGYA